MAYFSINDLFFIISAVHQIRIFSSTDIGYDLKAIISGNILSLKGVSLFRYLYVQLIYGVSINNLIFFLAMGFDIHIKNVKEWEEIFKGPLILLVIERTNC